MKRQRVQVNITLMEYDDEAAPDPTLSACGPVERDGTTRHLSASFGVPDGGEFSALVKEKVAELLK